MGPQVQTSFSFGFWTPSAAKEAVHFAVEHVKWPILDVPYVVQSQRTNCGPTALAMICRYFGVEPRDSRTRAHLCKTDQLMQWISLHARYEEGKSLYASGLAVAALVLGLHVHLYKHQSLSVALDAFVNADPTIAAANRDKLWIRGTRLGMVCKSVHLALDDFLHLHDQHHLLLVLLDWAIVSGRIAATASLDEQKMYSWFHFVVILGFDDRYVYFHSPQAEPCSHSNLDLGHRQRLSRSVFDSARLATGTIETFLRISNKPM